MNMVEIKCPHCNEDVELDEGEFGLFECPYCDEEFNWEEKKIMGSIKGKELWLRLLLNIGIFVALIFGVIAIVVYQYAEGMTNFQG